MRGQLTGKLGGSVCLAVVFAATTASADRIRCMADTYIQSDGTQFIDTGLYVTTNMSIEVVFEPEIDGTVRYLFGSYGSGSTMSYGLFMQNRKICFVHGARASAGWSNTGDAGVITAPARYKATYSLAERSILMYTGDSWQFNNWGVKLKSPGIETNNCTLGIFANHISSSQTGDWFKGKVYSFQVYDKGTLVQDMVPYGRGAVTGLLDRCSGNVYTNSQPNAHPFVLGTDSGYVRSNRTKRDGQYLDTGYYVNPQTKIEVDFAMMDISTVQQRVFGADNVGGLNLGLWVSANKKFAYRCSDSASDSTETDVTVTGARRTFTLDVAAGTATLVQNGTTEHSGTVASSRTQTATTSLRLFGEAVTNGAGTVVLQNPASVRIYGVKIWDGGTLVRNYVPRFSNGQEGLYDTVNNALKVADLTGLSATGKYRLGYGGDIECTSADAYLEASGAQALNTGFTLSLLTRLEIDCSLLDFAGTQYLFGTGAGGGHNGLYHQLGSTRSLLMCVRNASGGNNWPWLANNINQSHIKVTMDFKNAKATMSSPWSSSANLSLPSGDLGDTYNLWVMARNGGDYASARLYSFSIYNDDELVHDYIPCASNGVAGVWDRVGERFLANCRSADGKGFTLGGAGVSGGGMTFTQQPQSCRLSRGHVATLTAFAPGAMGYQWLKNGQVISGAIGQTLAVPYEKGCATDTYQCISHYAIFGYGVSAEAQVENLPSGVVMCIR